MLWDLVSFGGGYAMIPLIQEEVVERHGWMTAQAFTDVIAVAGMSPGPIAANSAIFIGYDQMGFWGALVSALGMILPSFLIILVIGTVFYKVQQSFVVKSAFYGLRSVVTGLIVYAAILFAMNNGLVSAISWHTISLWIIFGLSLLALIRFRIHPVYVILLSGLAGVALYG